VLVGWVGVLRYWCALVDMQRLDQRTKAERRGGYSWWRVCVFSSGLGCWSGKWHWGASYAVGSGIGLCTCLGATRTPSSPSPSLLCFPPLQCVLLQGLTHLLRHSPPIWSAAGSLADLTLSLLLSPSLSSFSAPGFSSSLSCWAATSTSHTLLNWCRGFWLLKSWQGWIARQGSYSGNWKLFGNFFHFFFLSTPLCPGLLV
jgi:hypothetical protein